MNAMNGKLLVFEGVDDVGKTTVSKALERQLQAQGVDCLWMSFPGREPGTIGREIYSIHHNDEYSDTAPLAMQLLHVAAHVDAIQRKILPALKAGKWVLLDRYWWSTYVYGVVGGISSNVLKDAIALEVTQWSSQLPAAAFLFERNGGAETCIPQRGQLVERYRVLAREEKEKYPVFLFNNEGTVAQAVEFALSNVGI